MGYQVADFSAIEGITGERSIIDSGMAYSPSILYDAVAGKFRVWYHQSFDPTLKFVHRESTSVDANGAITWGPPTIIRSGGPSKYGTHVIDTGVAGAQRFVNAYYVSGPGVVDGVHFEGSPDGLTWTDFGPNPVLTTAQADDIIDLWRDPTTGTYGMFVKRWSGAVGTSLRRTYVTTHANLTTAWPAPVPLFAIDGGDGDTTVTQFYGASGPIMRDGVMVFFLRMLRDDIERGVGYTVLAWSRDGVTFSRARAPFVDGRRGKPDEAMAWVYGACEYNGNLYLSYSGYDLGHKVGNRAAMVLMIPAAALALTD